MYVSGLTKIVLSFFISQLCIRCYVLLSSAEQKRQRKGVHINYLIIEFYKISKASTNGYIQNESPNKLYIVISI